MIVLLFIIHIRAYSNLYKNFGYHFKALKVALWKLCKASPIGTIKRWIGGNTELASAYKVVCTESEQADVVDE